jgi:hypothetical protein
MVILQRDDRLRERRTPMSEQSAEMVAYAVAFTVLVVAGMFLRTMILNFFVGPLIVVAAVAVVTPLLSRRRPP